MFVRPQKFVMLRHATSMPRHATSCHLKSRHVTSWHVMPRYVTSCHVMPRHVASCQVRPCHVMSCHVTSGQAMSRHVTSRHVVSCRKSRDCHTSNASLSTDFFHTQLIQVRHNRVRWLSRRVPIPYRISGILSSFIYFFFIFFFQRSFSETTRPILTKFSGIVYSGVV